MALRTPGNAVDGTLHTIAILLVAGGGLSLIAEGLAGFRKGPGAGRRTNEREDTSDAQPQGAPQARQETKTRFAITSLFLSGVTALLMLGSLLGLGVVPGWVVLIPLIIGFQQIHKAHRAAESSRLIWAATISAAIVWVLCVGIMILAVGAFVGKTTAP